MIDHYLEVIDHAINECSAVLDESTKFLKSVPTQTIHAKNQRGIDRYYVYDKRKKKETYISATEESKIKKLVEYELYRAVKKMAKSALFHLKCLRTIVEGRFFQSAINKLHPAKRKFLTNLSFDQAFQIQKWENANYPHQAFDENGIVTKKGDRVRSRAEKIFADLLFDLGVPYHYEQTIKIGNELFSVDFVLFDVVSGKEILVEYFGLINQPDYLRKMNIKQRAYLDAGYLMGDTMMFIYEIGDWGNTLASFESWLRFRFDLPKDNNLS